MQCLLTQSAGTLHRIAHRTHPSRTTGPTHLPRPHLTGSARALPFKPRHEPANRFCLDLARLHHGLARPAFVTPLQHLPNLALSAVSVLTSTSDGMPILICQSAAPHAFPSQVLPPHGSTRRAVASRPLAATAAPDTTLLKLAGRTKAAATFPAKPRLRAYVPNHVCPCCPHLTRPQQGWPRPSFSAIATRDTGRRRHVTASHVCQHAAGRCIPCASTSPLRPTDLPIHLRNRRRLGSTYLPFLPRLRIPCLDHPETRHREPRRCYPRLPVLHQTCAIGTEPSLTKSAHPQPIAASHGTARLDSSASATRPLRAPGCL